MATERGLEGFEGDVGQLAADGPRQWAIVGRREIWLDDGHGWVRVAESKSQELTCLSPGISGLLVGSAGAHLLHLRDGRLELVESFEVFEGRSSWYTPWGGPPDTRSIAVHQGSVFVNVHVGGVARSDDGGTWRPLVDIDVDVHQVSVGPDGSLLLATGAAGFGRSLDGGATWSWDANGLHGSYCRAVVVAGRHLLLSASTGPHGSQGALYRRGLDSCGDWTRVSGFVKGNVDTYWLAAAGRWAAFVSPDGVVQVSSDEGANWEVVGTGYRNPRSVLLR